ncbi:PAS domain S-box diguanylate cyclase (GGDEF) domain-containing protein, putative [Babesia caballi]|uniref:PAS domain S-box diguanylate cyclase (GGDEF) domain-containing protein, putative n=1 Tax=Babesia caballi TaxID=5871 RepID=A0AAV4M0T7_BABCB|nr:PAS domain S-box diguanylate cyclase (GGDEF) domain-containing protein, putative [Babesia caballi]
MPRTARVDFEEHKKQYLSDLFARIKSSGSISLSKVILLKDLLADVDESILKETLDHFLSLCKNRDEANMLVLIHDAVLNKGKFVAIPPIASLHDIYEEDNVEPAKAIADYKREFSPSFVTQYVGDIYKAEINRLLSMQMEQLSKTNPPEPPPMVEADMSTNRKTKLIQLLGEEMGSIVARSKANVEVASKIMLKPAWLVEFFNHAKAMDPPSCGWSVLLLDRDECRQLYLDVINDGLERVKEQILFHKETPLDESLHDVPKLAMLAYSRKHQLHHVCHNITDWERIEVDRTERLNKLFNFDLMKKSGPSTPMHRSVIGGGKPLPQPFYVNPEDDPNYDPPGSTVTSRLMRKMLQGDNEDTEKYVITDLETRKKSLAEVAKAMEPFEHLTPEQLSDLVLRNCKKEYELAEAIYRRRLRGRKIEDDNELRELADMDDGETQNCNELGGNASNGIGEETASLNVDSIYDPPAGYTISCNKLLTDALVFLSMLEHLQWQFVSAVDMPVETLVHVHDMGDSTTNPKTPKLLFVGARSREAYVYAHDFIRNESKADKYRALLRASIKEEPEGKTRKNVDKLLLFGDDPVFYLKDQELLQHMVQGGVGLEIHSKLPGFTLPPDPTEHQKSTVFYRLSTSQPQPQVNCPHCGYHIFSHTVKAHDGELLVGREYEALNEDTNPQCPACGFNEGFFTQAWVTGSRGYTAEPYPTPVEDEFADAQDV